MADQLGHAEQAFDEGLKLCRRVGNQPEEATILYEQARTTIMRAGKQGISSPGAFDAVQQLCQTARDIFTRYEMLRAVNMVDTLLEGLRQLDERKLPQTQRKIVEHPLAHEGYILDLNTIYDKIQELAHCDRILNYYESHTRRR